MRGKKTAQLAYRLTEEEKQAITEISEEFLLKPAEIVSTILAQFISAHKKYGKRLIWPPEFNYYISSKTKQDINSKKNK